MVICYGFPWKKNVSENEKSTIICHSHAESPEGMGYECSFIILNPYLHGQAWTLISHIIFACVGYPTGARTLVRIRLDVFSTIHGVVRPELSGYSPQLTDSCQVSHLLQNPNFANCFTRHSWLCPHWSVNSPFKQPSAGYFAWSTWADHPSTALFLA